MKTTLRSARREPLLHFLVLGLLILAVDAVAHPRSGDRDIVVDAAVIRDLSTQFETSRGRPPTRPELNELIDGWTINEILYREGRALGLDKGDDMIRERVIHKMRLVVFNNVVIEPPTDAELRAWYEEHRSRFGEPERYDFFDVRVDGHGEEARRLAEETLRAITEGKEPESLRERVRVYRERPRETVVAAFDEAFADALTQLPRGEWQAVPYHDEWHIVRVDAIIAAKPVDFDLARQQIESEWHDDRQRHLALSAVKELGTNYEVHRPEEGG
ncbi:MAG: peptidyl-prolyl cis-trans isomerase [Rhodospirillales bacterium]|nr:peptidyl-prolyl cis-trans isomerase [Rhodospirillales bacterium]